MTFQKSLLLDLASLVEIFSLLYAIDPMRSMRSALCLTPAERTVGELPLAERSQSIAQ